MIRWVRTLRRTRAEARFRRATLTGFGELNDHLLRDIGYVRERGPRGKLLTRPVGL